jgi:hypothetical protein
MATIKCPLMILTAMKAILLIYQLAKIYEY